MKICLSCEGVTETQAQRCGFCNARLVATDAVHYPVRRGELDAGNPLLGTVIDGKYRLQSVLGRGGLGTVFRAQHVGSLVTVALKLLHPRFSERPEYRRLLVPEARRAAAVVHDRCARVLDVGEGDEGITYLAMELVQGQTLDEVLQAGALPVAHVLDILIQVSAALAAVHEAGLVHCDLSPRNVMVSVEGGRLAAKVLDFGIARGVIAGVGGARGELQGFANPAFSAPELLAGEDVDARADIYSFGTLAWLMLTGSMPVDDADPVRAAAAVREGRLSAWPKVAGVPARLARLVQCCVRFAREERPATALDVHRQLVALRTGRGRYLPRVAMFVATVALVSALAVTGSERTAFLDLQPGALLELSAAPPPKDEPGSDLKAGDLDTLVCHYGGFRPRRLRVELARPGTVLTQIDLNPEVDPAAGTLLLSTAQTGWSEVVRGLVAASREGPVDLAFVVPGVGLLGVSRLRVDERPPTVEAQLEGAATTLRSDSVLLYRAADDLGIASVAAEVRFDAGGEATLALPSAGERFDIGRALRGREALAPHDSVQPRGSGSITVVVTDRAGFRSESAPLAFEVADLGAPEVTAIEGPAGQRSLTRLGDRLRFRVRLSAGEPGCRLRCGIAGKDQSVDLPLAVDVTDGPVSVACELAAGELVGDDDEIVLRLSVVDPAGNVSSEEFPVAVVDRSPTVRVVTSAAAHGPPVVWRRGELVLGPEGGEVVVAAGRAYAVVEARLESSARDLEADRVRLGEERDGGVVVRFAPLPAGLFRLHLSLTERAERLLAPVRRSVDVRVLPARIEVQVPTTRPHYVPGLLAAGVFGKRAAGVVGGLGEGPGWRLAAELRPYVGGWSWSGAVGAEVETEVRRAAAPLLPGLVPVRGRNRLLLRLDDVLGRRVFVVDRSGVRLPMDADGRQLVADYWWSDVAPQLVGEEVLVEYGQPARLRVRLPLPFRDVEPSELRLGVLNHEIRASQIAHDGARSIALFELPFADWSAAAELGSRPREDYAKGLRVRIRADITTPAGEERALTLPLTTTRSTLSPVRLGDLAALPEGLADLVLLPVLGPDGVFVEPVPPDAPPRFTFRPQQRVDVRNMPDILLQDREMVWRQALALAEVAASLTDEALRRRCVHACDPCGTSRLTTARLLPASAPPGAGDEVLAGVDYYQCWALSRLLGVAVAGDPALFRLPLGCELERAAFGDLGGTSCHGVGAHGGAVRMSAFQRPVARGLAPAFEREVGDVIATAYGVDFYGLDFGVSEWVLDLPHVPGREMLLQLWTDDHAVHLGRALAIGRGEADPPPDPVGPQTMLGVVRGLAFGDVAGLLDRDGSRLDPDRYESVPTSVPGVLRSEQLLRDGSDLLGRGRDPRLARIGFRIAADAAALARRWGYR
ncbi:MAG TPA: serine/threonine protein kinase [bacterium]|nr:serine/threonine protein kinase [bacterium]